METNAKRRWMRWVLTTSQDDLAALPYARSTRRHRTRPPLAA